MANLTNEQVLKLAEWREKWLRIGLCAEPADRRGAQEGVIAAYQAAGLDAPGVFVWLRSPLEGAIGSWMLPQVWGHANRTPRAMDQVGGQVRGQVWDQVVGQVWDQLRGQVRDQVGGQVWDRVRDQVDRVRDQVMGQVRGQVGYQVRGQVRSQVWDQVVGQVWDQVGCQVWDQLRGHRVRDQVGGLGSQVLDGCCCWGQHDAGWLGWIDYFRVVMSLACADRASGLIRIAECCGWWWPKRGAVVLTERPVHLERDAQNRLHSETRAAIEYPDGWGVYVWHGIRVPKSVITEREKATVQQIVAEKNTEIRRVMRNLYGNERFMRDAGAEEISRSDRHGCRLLRLHLPGDPVEIKMAELTCPSTGSVYYERVPPDVNDAVEALSWRFGIKPAEYEPSWET